jgi:hypothetical protein
LRRKKAAEKYSTFPDESSSGVAPLTVRQSRQRLDHELVDVHAVRARDGEHHALGHVLRGEGVDVRVDSRGLLLVPAEADAREVRLDEARIDRRQVNRPAEQVLPQGVREPTDGELRRDVDRGVLVRLPPGDRAHVDDMAAVADVRQAQAGHADQAVHVRLQHDLLVLLGARVEWVAPEAEAGVVDQDVEPAEFAHRPPCEPLAAGGVGDVELELDLGLELVDAARAAGDAGALGGKRACDRGPDPTRGAGDDRGLALEPRHEVGL